MVGHLFLSVFKSEYVFLLKVMLSRAILFVYLEGKQTDLKATQ